MSHPLPGAQESAPRPRNQPQRRSELNRHACTSVPLLQCGSQFHFVSPPHPDAAALAAYLDRYHAQNNGELKQENTKTKTNTENSSIAKDLQQKGNAFRDRTMTQKNEAQSQENYYPLEQWLQEGSREETWNALKAVR